MGSQGSSSSSAPLTAEQRQETYGAALKNLQQYLPAQDSYRAAPVYDTRIQAAQPYQAAGAYQDAGDARSLTGGDYNRLEQQLSQSQLADLEYQKSLQDEAANQSMADRGIWSSGLAIRDANMRGADYNRARASILGGAAAQRYNMQTAEQQALNQYGLQRSQNANAFNSQRADAANQFNLQNTAAANQADLARAGMLNQTAGQRATDEWNAKWRPAEYLQGVWNGTGGTISSGSSGGWSI